MSDSIVIIPTYNECENVETMIRKVFSLEIPFDILIVDDGSPDGTASIVKRLTEEYPDRLFIIEREGKLGLGTAYIAGFKWCLSHSYQYIFEMDCDFSHPVNKLIELRATCMTRADVAVGSRYIKGGKLENWPMGRILMSYFASVYVRIVTWMNVRDTTAGFVGYRNEVLRTINLDNIHFKGYAFQIEMKYTAKCLGFKIKEIPITFTNRILGSSKMNSSIFGEAFVGVLKLRYWHIFKGFPKPTKNG